MEFEQFKDKSLQRKGKLGKIRNSFGVYDVYKLIRKHGWYNVGRPIKEGEFYGVVREVNKLLAEELAKGQPIKFPKRMGALELKKFERGVSIVGGNLKNTYPIDWKETWRLWEEDMEARNKKILIRDEQKWVFCIRYNKYKANYNNKSFYQFAVNKFIKWNLRDNIKQGKIDALW